MKLKFFKSAADFHEWLEANHSSATELWVGFYRQGSGKGGITYAEALDEALCFGWIDGVRKRVDEISFTQRFTPRKPKSNWSLLNIRHVGRLKQARRMTAAGLKAFAARDAARSGVYSFENKPRELSPELEQQFRSDKAAWEFFQQQPPGYRRLASFWVMSAKQEETRQRRLARLMEDSSHGRRLGLLGGRNNSQNRHGANLRRAAHRARPPSAVALLRRTGRKRRAHQVVGRLAGGQLSFDARHDVHHVTVTLDDHLSLARGSGRGWPQAG